jgi:hypothetical protein
MLLAFGCRWQLSFQLPESCPILADENCDSCFALCDEPSKLIADVHAHM